MAENSSQQGMTKAMMSIILWKLSIPTLVGIIETASPHEQENGYTMDYIPLYWAQFQGLTGFCGRTTQSTSALLDMAGPQSIRPPLWFISHRHETHDHSRTANYPGWSAP